MTLNNLKGFEKVLQQQIKGTLGYYSLFKYPITLPELHGSLPEPCSLPTLTLALEELVYSKEISHFGIYYSLESDISSLIAKRQNANKLAEFKIPQAIKIASFIYRFPFVKFVGISGSLSKGAAAKNSDFDFFIITQKNRLWICRTLLHIYKKTTFLRGRQHQYCMNYFIDTNNLEIEEKNRYTAIELSSMIPVSGHEEYENMVTANKWIQSFLPNGYSSFYQDKRTLAQNTSLWKPIFELVFNSLFPGFINRMLMRITNLKWKKKWSAKKFPMNEYDLAFKTTLHISKNHPANYQKRVLEALSKFEN